MPTDQKSSQHRSLERHGTSTSATGCTRLWLGSKVRARARLGRGFRAKAHVVQNLVSLVAADGVDLVAIVDGVVAELVLDRHQMSTGLQGTIL